jgi:glycosyltransferase involved in cell wall biosynthesis
LRIVHLIYSEQVAGAENYLLTLLPRLKSEGIDTHLICVTPRKDKHKFIGFCEELNNKQVKTVLMTGKITDFLSVAGSIDKYLRSNNIKHLHAHLFKSDLLAVLVKKIFNRKVFLLSTKHGYQESYLSQYQKYQGKIPYNLYYFIARLLAANINQHITISRGMSELYYKLNITAGRMKYIHHGITISAAGQANSVDYRFGPQQLVIVGRIEPIKGHQYLLQAMPAIIEIFPMVKLLVIGNGTQKELLQKQAMDSGISESVLFLGFQQNPADYISNSDVIIVPSLFEPFGLVYIEAFALKTPVVAFDVPASNEIISDNETGMLVPAMDSKALADRIIHLLLHAEERKRIAENGYSKYKNHFNAEKMVKETAEWYRSVISG